MAGRGESLQLLQAALEPPSLCTELPELRADEHLRPRGKLFEQDVRVPLDLGEASSDLSRLPDRVLPLGGDRLGDVPKQQSLAFARQEDLQAGGEEIQDQGRLPPQPQQSVLIFEPSFRRFVPLTVRPGSLCPRRAQPMRFDSK